MPACFAQSRFRRLLTRALLPIALAAPAAAMAAEAAWPAARPITLVVPYSAGGSTDVIARLLAQKLGERLHQSVVVDNTTGAGGVIGVRRAVQAAPDGYTLVMGADSSIAIARLVNPAAVKYDALKDLEPIGLVNTAAMVLVARSGLQANTLDEVLKLARAQPGKLTYATSGIGTVLQVAMEMIKAQAKVEINHVPYRGAAQQVTDLMGQQVDLAMLISASAIPNVAAGKIKGIAVTSARRLEALPKVPAAAETPAFKGFEINSWTGLFAPARTPAPIVERLNRELNAILASADVVRTMKEQGVTPGHGDAAGFATFIQREQGRYARIVESAGIRE